MDAVACRWTGVLILSVLLCGCGESGPAVYVVKGTVSYQDKPLPLGIVMFVPSDGPAVTATINPDGSYSLEATPGKHKVGVVAMPPVEGGRPDPSREGGIDYTNAKILPSLVPEKYNNYSTSGVEVEVQPTAENHIDVVLK